MASWWSAWWLPDWRARRAACLVWAVRASHSSSSSPPALARGSWSMAAAATAVMCRCRQLPRGRSGTRVAASRVPRRGAGECHARALSRRHDHPRRRRWRCRRQPLRRRRPHRCAGAVGAGRASSDDAGPDARRPRSRRRCGGDRWLRFARDEIWEGVSVPAHVPMRLLAAQAASLGVVWTHARRRDARRYGGVDVRVWHPPAPDWERPRVRNDDSVVIELRFGDVSVVLPGDIGPEVEAAARRRASAGADCACSRPRITAAGRRPRPPGSTRSPPRAVVISAGRDNRHGHPSPIVLARLRDRGDPGVPDRS